MKINHDRSFLDCRADAFISRGLAETRPYSIRIRFEYTEAQRGENVHFAEAHTREEWNARCSREAKTRSEYIRPVMEAIAQKFVCYQYEALGKYVKYCGPDWDLFFWCNDFHSTTNGAFSGRDFSYLTLSFNDRHDTTRREEIRRDLMRLLVDDFSDMENLAVAVQLETHFFDGKISEIVKANHAKLDGLKCHYLGTDGRLVKSGDHFYFLRKRARTCGHLMSERELVAMLWQSET